MAPAKRRELFLCHLPLCQPMNFHFSSILIGMAQPGGYRHERNRRRHPQIGDYLAVILKVTCSQHLTSSLKWGLLSQGTWWFQYH